MLGRGGGGGAFFPKTNYSSGYDRKHNLASALYKKINGPWSFIKKEICACKTLFQVFTVFALASGG